MNWNRKLALGAALLSLWAGLFADGISRAADGRMQTEDLKFGLIVTMDDGTRVEQQSDGVLTFPDEMPQQTKEGIVRFGKLRLADDAVFHLRETLQQISKNEIRFEQILESPETAPTRRFGVGCWLSFERYQKRPVQVDGKPYPFNGRMSEKWIKGKLFEFPLRKGIAGLLFPDGAEILIKPFGKSVLCQVIFSFGKKRTVKARWHLRYKPYVISSVDLRPALNMGFADPVAEDGAGGWTDQGPENDLSMMKTGKQVLAGIPFEVIDPAENNGKSCLLMRGGARPSFCRSASVSVPGYTGRTLFLLNAIAWPPAPGTPVGKVVVVYEDGGRMEYLLKRGRDTENFWAPRNLPNAQVGSQTGKGYGEFLGAAESAECAGRVERTEQTGGGGAVCQPDSSGGAGGPQDRIPFAEPGLDDRGGLHRDVCAAGGVRRSCHPGGKGVEGASVYAGRRKGLHRRFFPAAGRAGGKIWIPDGEKRTFRI